MQGRNEGSESLRLSRDSRSRVNGISTAGSATVKDATIARRDRFGTTVGGIHVWPIIMENSAQKEVNQVQDGTSRMEKFVHIAMRDELHLMLAELVDFNYILGHSKGIY